MSSKELILNKLKKTDIKDRLSIPSSNADKDIFSDYPDKNSLLDLFANRFEALNGELHLAKDIEKASEKLNSVLSTMNEKKCITFSSNLIKNIISSTQDFQSNFDVLDDKYMESNRFATYSVGLTTADFLVARTGSIVLNSLNHGGRRLSVLPPVHIVVANTNQIVFSLEDIFNKNFTFH